MGREARLVRAGLLLLCQVDQDLLLDLEDHPVHVDLVRQDPQEVQHLQACPADLEVQEDLDRPWVRVDLGAQRDLDLRAVPVDPLNQAGL